MSACWAIIYSSFNQFLNLIMAMNAQHAQIKGCDDDEKRLKHQ